SSSPFNIAAGEATDGVNGTLTANAGGTAGSGGTITVLANGGGGISLGAITNISLAATQGDGGVLTLNAGGTTAGPLTIPAGTLSVNGVGNGNYAGGTLTLRGLTISVTGGSASILNANAAGLENGGTVSITTTGAAGDLIVGNGLGQFQISASGGS